MTLRTGVCSLVAVALVAGLAAQAPPPEGLILGAVVDAATGKGVPAAIVTLGAPAAAPVALGELVEISSAPAVTGRRIVTSSDGRFLFRDLPKGRYALAVAAPGYEPASYGQGRPGGTGQSIDLEDGAKLGDVNVRVWKLASITGTVTDDRGEPAVGVGVRCMRRVIAGGQPRFTTQGTLSSTTDDRGIYRAASLVPGDYICGIAATQTTTPISVIDASESAPAGSPPGASAMSRTMAASGGRIDTGGFRVGDFMVRPGGLGGRGVTAPAPAPDGRMMTFPIQYYSGALTTTQATVISLKSGEARSGVDLQLRLVPAVRVSGTIAGPEGAASFVGLTLVPAAGADLVSEGSAEAARTISDASGRFTFLSIPAGQYVLRVRVYPRVAGAAPTGPVESVSAAAVELGLAAPGGSPTGRGGVPPPPPAEPGLWANVPVSVGDTNISNMAVTLRTGIAVAGRVEFVGTRQAPTAEQIQRMTIRMQSAEGRTSSPIPAEGRATPDGPFRTAAYAGGNYIASVLASTIPPGWSLRSIASGGRDISVEPVDLTDAAPTDVVITFTDRTTTLAGTVTDARNAPQPNADVVVFPADSQAWKTIGVVARRWRAERVTRAGAFSIPGLPPGDYFVAAVPTDSPRDPRDPRFLEALERTATRVTLADGETRTMSIRIR